MEAHLPIPLPEAEAAVRAALADQGFGVLTEIDVAATLKAKLDVDRAPLKILGACNPSFADQALRIDPTTALVLPCNVALVEEPGGGTTVRVVDPRALMPGDELGQLADDAAERLRAALDAAAAA
jgi:uncharacterized protein (DUF302 family)